MLSGFAAFPLALVLIVLFSISSSHISFLHSSVKICLLSALRECLSIGRQVMASSGRSEEKIVWDAEEFRSGYAKKQPSWARAKIEASLWVILSLVAISACDLKTVLLYDDRVHRWALHISYWCICVNGGILLYLNLYALPRSHAVHSHLPIRCSRVRASAPVYSFFSLPAPSPDI
jgi:hypothetical protein